MELITTYLSLPDFDSKLIEYLPLRDVLTKLAGPLTDVLVLLGTFRFTLAGVFNYWFNTYITGYLWYLGTINRLLLMFMHTPLFKVIRSAGIFL